MSEAGTWVGRALIHIADKGWTGVDLFFVLSGFLITRILLDARTATNYFRVFYARRILPIFPIYYLSLIFFFWILPFLAHHSTFFYLHRIGEFSPYEQLWYWFNLVNFRTAFYPLLIPVVSHYWTLSIEEQFYAVWPAIVRLCTPRQLAIICSSVITAVFVLRQIPAFLAINAVYDNFLYRLTPFRVDSLLFGALVALLFYQSEFTAAQRQRLFRAAIVIFLLALAVLLCFVSPDPAQGHYSFTLLAILYSALLVACLTGTSVACIFRFAPLRTFGKYSYSMYIFHSLVFRWGSIFIAHFTGPKLFPKHGYGSTVIQAAVLILLCLGVARISWLLIEEPTLRLKKYFRYVELPN